MVLFLLMEIIIYRLSGVPGHHLPELLQRGSSDRFDGLKVFEELGAARLAHTGDLIQH